MKGFTNKEVDNGGLEDYFPNTSEYQQAISTSMLVSQSVPHVFVPDVLKH